MSGMFITDKTQSREICIFLNICYRILFGDKH